MHVMPKGPFKVLQKAVPPIDEVDAANASSGDLHTAASKFKRL